jgi:hypothetical protein
VISSTTAACLDMLTISSVGKTTFQKVDVVLGISLIHFNGCHVS